MANKNSLTNEEYGAKLLDHIKKIEETNELEAKAQKQSKFNVWFNEKLIKFLNEELDKLEMESIQNEKN